MSEQRPQLTELYAAALLAMEVSTRIRTVNALTPAMRIMHADRSVMASLFNLENKLADLHEQSRRTSALLEDLRKRMSLRLPGDNNSDICEDYQKKIAEYDAAIIKATEEYDAVRTSHKFFADAVDEYHEEEKFTALRAQIDEEVAEIERTKKTIEMHKRSAICTEEILKKAYRHKRAKVASYDAKCKEVGRKNVHPPAWDEDC